MGIRKSFANQKERKPRMPSGLERVTRHIGNEKDPNFAEGSSGESWAMCDIHDPANRLDGDGGFLSTSNGWFEFGKPLTVLAKTRASSRGNTGGASFFQKKSVLSRERRKGLILHSSVLDQPRRGMEATIS